MRSLIVSVNNTKAPFPVPPVGAAMVAKALSARGVRTDFLDLCFERSPLKRLKRELEKGVKWAGLSFRNLDNVDSRYPESYLSFLKEICDVLRKRDVPFVIGGPATAIAPGALLDYTGALSVFPGSAESFAEYFLKNGLPHGVVKTPQSGSLNYRGVEKLIDFKAYLSFEKMAPVRMKQGCRNHCSYCPYSAIEGRSITFYDINSQKRYIERWLERGVGVDIIDAVFNEPLNRARSLCRELLGAGLKGNYHISSFSPLYVSKELLKEMSQLGATSLMIGADSGSDTMLSSYNKPFRMSDIKEFMEIRKEFNLKVLWTFLAGGPGETEGTLKETMEFIETLPPTDVAYITPGVRIYPKTSLHKKALEEKALAPEDKLLRPQFYFSKNMDKQKLMDKLGAWEAGLDNVSLSTRSNGPFASISLKVSKPFHGASPSWQGIPAMKKWLRRSGLLDIIAPS